jgi:hypothetical protein
MKSKVGDGVCLFIENKRKEGKDRTGFADDE